MNSQTIQANEPVHSLTTAFMMNLPAEAARLIEAMPVAEASQALMHHSTVNIIRVLERMVPGLAENLLLALPENITTEILNDMDSNFSTAMLSRFNSEDRERFLSLIATTTAKELRSLLEYPEDTAGRLMRAQVIAFHENISVADAIEHMRELKIDAVYHLYLLDSDMQLQGQVDIRKLALVNPSDTLKAISTPVKVVAQALDPKDELLSSFEKYRLHTIPVVDMNQRILGVLEDHDLISTLREDAVSSMQTMVGASKDERALSSSFFAVKKRLPWLQINLITAFLAAAVVGMFESTIAKYTALAILLPIAAGQSGNAGAQALAVTMRGLTLREISMKHWLRVLIKECSAGLMNGIGVAITCSIGVYLWSQSFGLALVMALSMIISMTIAGMAGAVVPILLKRFGLDPAQSSSIVLTTITDIAGFMSFLGIATLLSSMLTAG